MLNEIKIRGLYAEIQNQLFHMIPEKWDELYLYASILDQVNGLQTGEMFFYYFPTGLLRKNPVNVYEIPIKFNIEEDLFLKLVEKLYGLIKKIRKEYEDAHERMWSSLTISIAKNKFKVEYLYEDLLGSKLSSYDRHLIWQYQYLNIPLERLTRKDREMVIRYIEESKLFLEDFKEEILPLYKNRDKYNKVEYLCEKEPQPIPKQRLDKYEIYKQQKSKEEEETKEAKNQILNF